MFKPVTVDGSRKSKRPYKKRRTIFLLRGIGLELNSVWRPTQKYVAIYNFPLKNLGLDP
jgi:hypothetical protein